MLDLFIEWKNIAMRKIFVLVFLLERRSETTYLPAIQNWRPTLTTDTDTDTSH